MLAVLLCAGIGAAQETGGATSTPEPSSPVMDAPVPAPSAPRTLYRISPDGATLAWVEFVEGVDVVVAQARTLVSGPAGSQVPPLSLLYEAPAGVADLQFSSDGRRIVIDLEDDAGVLSAPLDSASPIPAPGGVARIGDTGESLVRLSYGRPRRALLVQRSQTGEVVGAARVDIETGEREEAAELTPKLDQLHTPFDVLADATLSVRVVMERGPGGVVRARRTGVNTGMLLETRAGAIFRALGLSDDGRLLYAIDGRERIRTALTVTNIESGETAVLVDDPNADVDAAMLHPIEGFAQAARFNTNPSQWLMLQRTIAADMRGLRDAAEGAYSVVSRTSDDSLWVVRYDQADGRPEWRLLDTTTDVVTALPDEAPITEQP
jgi:hypothetical protein